MSRLQEINGPRSWVLPARSVIGRSPMSEVYLEDSLVSAEHALLRWYRGRWELQDLHSRNGTYVGGHRLASGERLILEPGVTVGFGRPEQYTLETSIGPIAHAVNLESPHVTIEADDGLLGLPDLDAPELTIFHREDRWWLESGDSLAPVTDTKIISTSSGTWRLHLPVWIPPTSDAEDTPLFLADLVLTFIVSEPDMSIRLIASRGARHIDLGIRAHHTPLLALARARAGDHERPRSERGWVFQDVLLEALDYEATRLYVEIHRARRQLIKAGIMDAVQIVERRPETCTLRIGVANLEIQVAPSD
ncbi:MAG: FHA domain-containing protein [Myxococcales bacterium]|nr:FHA domain-containing protein [Myxococcales bacterium]